ncbi:MAG: hypothetical protein J6S43_05740 [Lentisphaeria bacterium]|nr:hypothetical protein [Lentisphaeria bacterium]
MLKHQRLLDKTFVFCQTQFYTLNELPGSYLGRYVDSPLFLDPAGDNSKRILSILNLQKNAGFDGCTVYDGTGRENFWVLNPIRESGSSMKTLAIECRLPRKDYKNFDRLYRLVAKTPNYLYYNGKPIILGYWTGEGLTPQTLEKVLAERRKAVGDFLYLPDMPNIANWASRYLDKGQKVPAAKREEIKELLRKWLRVADGMHFNGIHYAEYRNDVRSFPVNYIREYILGPLLEVFNEPEFKGKKLLSIGMVSPGHENAYALGYYSSSDGTVALRKSMDLAMSVNPDIISVTEWDEWNENTHFCPSVWNGFTISRIMRYYRAVLQKQAAEPMPGDDVTIPNLAVSYRKIISLGEVLKVEILSIPDSKAGGVAEVKFVWKSIDGKVVKEFPTHKVDLSGLNAIELPAASEEFAAHRTLVPELTVTINGKSTVYSAGFPPLDIRAAGNWDYKYAQISLRDLAKLTCEFKAVGNDRYSVKVDSPVPLKYVQIVSDGHISYVYDKSGRLDEFRSSPERLVIAVNIIRNLEKKITGTIEVSGAEDVKIFQEGKVTAGNSIPVKRAGKYWRHPAYISIPAAAVNTAVLKITTSEGDGEISFKDLVEKDIFTWGGEYGFSISAAVFRKQPYYPPHLNEKSAEFEVPVKADRLSDVLFVQIITADNRIYRSRPLVAEAAAGPRSFTCWSSTHAKAVNVTTTGARLPDLVYDLSDKRGTVLYTPAGRAYCGITGTSLTQVNLRNFGAGATGTVFSAYPSYDKATVDSYPEQRSAGGQNVLVFDSDGDIAHLPQGVLPRTAAWELNFDVKVDDPSKQQVIFNNRTSHIYGLIAKFILNNGKLSMTYCGMKADSELKSNLTLEAGTWHHIRVVCTLDSFLFFVDGKSSGIRRIASKPGRFDCNTMFGGMPGEYFKGQIRNIRISYPSNK